MSETHPEKIGRRYAPRCKEDETKVILEAVLAEVQKRRTLHNTIVMNKSSSLFTEVEQHRQNYRSQNASITTEWPVDRIPSNLFNVWLRCDKHYAQSLKDPSNAAAHLAMSPTLMTLCANIRSLLRRPHSLATDQAPGEPACLPVPGSAAHASSHVSLPSDLQAPGALMPPGADDDYRGGKAQKRDAADSPGAAAAAGISSVVARYQQHVGGVIPLQHQHHQHHLQHLQHQQHQFSTPDRQANTADLTVDEQARVWDRAWSVVSNERTPDAQKLIAMQSLRDVYVGSPIASKMIAPMLEELQNQVRARKQQERSDTPQQGADGGADAEDAAAHVINKGDGDDDDVVDDVEDARQLS